MNGEFKRGEVYWVRMDNGVGSEEGSLRPALIISSDKGNESSSTMNCLFLTSREKFGIINVKTFVTGRPSYVMCNQIFTVDKVRVGEYRGTLPPKAMAAVERGLKVALGLETTEESDDLQRKVESLESEIETLRAENNHRAQMFQRMYEKALDELAALKLEMDLKGKCSEKCDKKGEDCSEKRVETVEKVAVAEAKKKVNINTATAIEIVTSLGVNTNYAYKITQYRKNNGNFVDIEELRDVKGLPKDFVERYGNLIMIGENDQIEIKNDEIERPKIAKVNINTATAEEISEVSGLNIYTARKIRAYRNKHGLFKSVDDLMNVDRFGKGCMSMYGDKFEV